MLVRNQPSVPSLKLQAIVTQPWTTLSQCDVRHLINMFYRTCGLINIEQSPGLHLYIDTKIKFIYEGNREELYIPGVVENMLCRGGGGRK